MDLAKPNRYGAETVIYLKDKLHVFVNGQDTRVYKLYPNLLNNYCKLCTLKILQ